MKIEEKIKELEKSIYRDEGEISKETIQEVEASLEVKFPKLYVDFIAKHNGARARMNDFDFYDNNLQRDNTDAISFSNVLEIKGIIESVMASTTDDPDDPDIFKFYHYFFKWLVPFGETGGGNLICFDYRKDHKTDNPPITYWTHDVEDEESRFSFIANNFEEFVDMLYEYDEAYDDDDNYDIRVEIITPDRKD